MRFVKGTIKGQFSQLPSDVWTGVDGGKEIGNANQFPEDGSLGAEMEEIRKVNQNRNDITSLAASELVRVAKELVSTRPINIDRSVAIDCANEVIRELQSGYWKRHSEEELGTRFQYVTEVEIRNLKFNDVVIQVQFKSKVSKGVVDFVLGAGSGKTRTTKKPAILVMLNGTYSANALAVNSTEKFRKDITNVLLHELTHQADVYARPLGSTSTEVKTEGEVDLVGYYNHPSEVRAYMREVVEEVLDVYPKMMKVFDKGKSFKYSLRMSETWQRIESHLTKGNRELILKGVYRSIEDEYGFSGLELSAGVLVRG
jgi:hypothetical protein